MRVARFAFQSQDVASCGEIEGDLVPFHGINVIGIGFEVTERIGDHLAVEEESQRTFLSGSETGDQTMTTGEGHVHHVLGELKFVRPDGMDDSDAGSPAIVVDV